MKFLQFALDRGQLVSGNEVTTLNERELASGRSLRRPQNTPSVRNNCTSSGSSNNDVTALPPLQQFDSMPFEKFLAIEYKMSKKLAGMIRHALCYIDIPAPSDTSVSSASTTKSVSTGQALDMLYANINCIGKFGETPFITCMYGSAELPQAFCRLVFMCYVYMCVCICMCICVYVPA